MDAEHRQHDRLAADLERRAHFRVECDLPATYAVPDEDLNGDGCVSNIGFGGARVDFPVDLPIPCRVQLTILDTAGKPLVLECDVTWTTTANDSNTYPTGLRFREVSDKLKARLFELLIDLMNG